VRVRRRHRRRGHRAEGLADVRAVVRSEQVRRPLLQGDRRRFGRRHAVRSCAVRERRVTPLDVWNALGGQGETPACLGRYAGPLLILGGGRTVWSDYDQVRPWKGEIMAVNDVGQFLHEVVKHWVTLHPEYMPGWMK